MKKIFFCLLSFSSLLIAGCSKEPLNDSDLISTDSVNEAQLNDLAKVFASIQLDGEDLSSVFSNVQAASYFGLDEEMYLSELWNSSE